jgi:uncharacterized protein (TIGR03083 family)
MLARHEVVEGLDRELIEFTALIRSLAADEWERPTRCPGWRVADVSAHVAGTITDITAGRLEGLDTPEVTERQVAERRGQTAAAVADELDRERAVNTSLLEALDDDAWASPAPGAYGMTLGLAVASLWCGFYVHADDIRAAIGRPSERGPGLRASVHYLADALSRRGWGPAVVALDGMEEIPVGDAPPDRDGSSITGDPVAFVLAATGRADPRSIGLNDSVNVFG